MPAAKATRKGCVSSAELGEVRHSLAIDRLMEVYAHSLPGRPQTSWELLSNHLDATAELAGCHAGAFGWARVGALLGRLHDVGKVSPEFQGYIRKVQLPGENARGGDHSSAGARVASGYGSLSRVLAYAIAGHHAGLADVDDLDRRLDPARTTLPSYAGWEAQAGVLPPRKHSMQRPKKRTWNAETGLGWPTCLAAFAVLRPGGTPMFPR